MELASKLIEIEHLNRRAKFEQVAEECGELGQACMKFVRAEGNGNPCRISKDEAFEQVIEETADLFLAIDGMLYDIKAEYYDRTGIDIFRKIEAVYDFKAYRWNDELKKKKEEEKTE